MSASFNLNQCAPECIDCIKSYIKKHSLVKGKDFELPCSGILKNNIPLNLINSFSVEDRKLVQSTFDPVTWAAEVLDWHCEDPDGSIWKRKNPDEYYQWIKENPGKDIFGFSRYHRPYQKLMLQCTSKRKVLRLGRQNGKTESLVISILYNMFTRPGVEENAEYKVLVITPYQTQVELIFTRLEQLISSSESLKNSVARNVKHPNYAIKLHNKSKVFGFTAGTKAGNNAGSVRGQTANLLVIDEGDYLNPQDIDAILAVITNHPNASVWISSTPTGKRERFFELCQSKRWKEFHFPSYVNPMWNQRTEMDFREALTELAYQQEIEADFGEQQQGVFQNQYVKAAKAEYKYGDYKPGPGWTYTFGVDWNDTKTGTTINVLGFSHVQQKFFIVDRHIVGRDGWTQLTACKKIVELNRIWKPTAIYVDIGFGSTQIEVLHAYSHEAIRDPLRGASHPDGKLLSIVKGYSFSTKIETKDIFTKQPILKASKPFLVESAVRRFENKDIFFPETDTDLEDQLLGYVIKHFTQTGMPVYEAGNEQAGDHALDALMLSIVAFVMEVTPVGKVNYSSKIGFSGYFGQVLDTNLPASKKKDNENPTRPSMNRTTIVTQNTIFPKNDSLPGNNLNQGSKVGLWAWPNFGSDGSRPKVRSIGQATEEAKKRKGYTRSTIAKPRRRNI